MNAGRAANIYRLLSLRTCSPETPTGVDRNEQEVVNKIADLGAIVYTTTTGYHPPNEVTCLIPLRNTTPNRWIRKVRPGTESAIDRLSLSP